MRYEIHFAQNTNEGENKNEWTSKASFCRVITCESDDVSQIMSSFIELCRDFPEVVSRHSIRIFDNYIFDWLVMTRVPEQFEAYNDPICIIWNQHLPDDHPILEFRPEKKRLIFE
jgi:hypothetical protein